MCFSLFSSCFPSKTPTFSHEVVATPPANFNSAQNEIITSISALDADAFITGNIDGDIFRIDWREDTSQLLDPRAHTASITATVQHHRDRYFITASRDRSIRIFDSERMRQTAVIADQAHTLSISALDAAHKTQRVWSGGRDTTVKLWDIAKTACVFSGQIDRNIPQFICVNQHEYNGSVMLECCEDLKLRVWDEREADVTQSIGTGPNIPLCCDIAEDGVHVVVSFNGFEGHGCELKLYDMRKWGAEDSEMWSQQAAHQQAVTVCKFVPSAARLSLLSGSKDTTVKVWNVDDRDCFTLDIEQPVNDIAVVDDLALIAANEGVVHIMKLSTDFERTCEIVAVGSNSPCEIITC